MFPNPTDGMISINNVESCNLTLSDVAGRVLLQQTNTSKTANMDISGLATGVYMLQTTKNDGTKSTVKVVKE